MNVIDLFCGAGGLSRGFMDAGFKIIVGCDNDQDALNTFSKNHDGGVALNADLSKQETIAEILKIVDGKQIDVVIAGPPCQSFSLTGKRRYGVLDDPRNYLYKAVVDLIGQVKPKGFIIENVPGMFSMHNGNTREEILRCLRELGYNVDCKILLAADYGVPQTRKRLVFMGVRKDIGEPVFPRPTHGPSVGRQYITCEEAIDDLPSREDGSIGKSPDRYTHEPNTEYERKMRGLNNILYNHVATAHKDFVKEVIAMVPDGGNYKDLPEGVGTSRTFHMAWTRLNSKLPARTVDTGHRNLFHYKYNRVPTVRESARMQSFPDNFVFTGSRTKQERQVGNAVPPLVGYALGMELRKIIEGREAHND